jgi:hypothetical protein
LKKDRAHRKTRPWPGVAIPGQPVPFILITLAVVTAGLDFTHVMNHNGSLKDPINDRQKHADGVEYDDSLSAVAAALFPAVLCHKSPHGSRLFRYL